MNESDVHIEYYNDVFCRIHCDAGILMELSDAFTFFKPNYRFDPRYKARAWDGKIRLINRMTRMVYCGLIKRIKKFCDARGYTFTFDEKFYYDNVSVAEVDEHIKSLDLPEWLDTRDYQADAVVKCLRSKRRTLISPTSSGKSLMIYIIAMWYKKKTLIIVPRTGLVEQFKDDIRKYGFKGKIHTSTDGLLKDNNIDADFVITTWQSLDSGKRKLPQAWFNQFKVVFGDEAHGAKATTLKKIFEAMTNTPYRFGTTGTLDDQPLNRATIEGLLGPTYQSISTREMIDQGYAPDIIVKCLVLRYPESVRQDYWKGKRKTYHEEIDFITTYQKRISYVKNLALSLKGNKLVFFKKIDHGKEIHKALAEKVEKLYYIDGSVDVNTREEIRKALESDEDAILVASLGTTSTGISINNLHHMIAASPSKAKITLLQSIGRMLRQHHSKTHVEIYDIVDDLSMGTTKQNYALLHFLERVKIYDAQKFSYKIYNIGLS